MYHLTRDNTNAVWLYLCERSTSGKRLQLPRTYLIAGLISI